MYSSLIFKSFQDVAWGCRLRVVRGAELLMRRGALARAKCAKHLKSAYWLVTADMR